LKIYKINNPIFINYINESSNKNDTNNDDEKNSNNNDSDSDDIDERDNKSISNNTNYFLKENIKYFYISKSLQHLKERVSKVYSLKLLKDDFIFKLRGDCNFNINITKILFFGLYDEFANFLFNLISSISFNFLLSNASKNRLL
jgi:hypothetical protein